MKRITKISILLILVMMSSLLISCGQEDKKTYPNATYTNNYITLEYPSNWEEHPTQAPPQDSTTISGTEFISMKDFISFKVYTRQLITKEELELLNLDYLLSKFIEEGEITENDCEDYVLDGVKGYKIKTQEDNQIYTCFVFQNNDLIVELNFQCSVLDYDNYEDIFEQIAKSIKYKTLCT